MLKVHKDWLVIAKWVLAFWALGAVPLDLLMAILSTDRPAWLVCHLSPLDGSCREYWGMAALITFFPLIALGLGTLLYFLNRNTD
ncbi:MAG: hypothetical protein CMF73_07675 [Maricaulis sp.]|jgi:hypothetical protein|nr:hypothetical protein [Maricaulis sp.]